MGASQGQSCGIVGESPPGTGTPLRAVGRARGQRARARSGARCPPPPPTVAPLALLTQGAKELPPIPPRHNGQRGRVAKSDAHNLWERLQKHETDVLLFANHPHVASGEYLVGEFICPFLPKTQRVESPGNPGRFTPFTNNRAERDLRMSKVKQKVSECFRTRRYAEAYCRISSYLQSMANQGYNPLVAIQIALAGDAVKNLGE